MAVKRSKLRPMGKKATAQDLDTYSGRLGARIRKQRAALEMSVESFVTALKSRDVEVENVTVYAWESGRNPIPLNAVPAIAATLRVPVLDLLPKK